MVGLHGSKIVVGLSAEGTKHALSAHGFGRKSSHYPLDGSRVRLGRDRNQADDVLWELLRL